MAKKKDELKHSDEEELLDAPVPEETARGGEEGEAKAEGEQPKEPSELEKALAAAEDYRRKWYSVSAEYDNFRKRNQSAVAQAYADGKAEAILKLLPVADNFGYAYEGAPDEKTKTGIDKIIKSFNTILSSLGVEEIAINIGDQFDESVAEAIMNVPAGEGEQPNTVNRVLKKGYRQGDKVIRFAQVIVTN
ncbi:MAG TPA: nucleotide exchange factor GrpE [Candidatus Coproplasma excrementipullorum]|nr:nucleotide exchange factor GrpE [Candidatus Coproplasma excrementipullorum]